MIRNSIIIILFIANSLYSAEFEFTPLKIDFEGIEIKNDTVVAYGNFGSFFVSCDNKKTWSQVLAFDNGSIIKLYIESNRWLAITDDGKAGISSDGGKTWYQKQLISDSVLAMIKYPGGYFIRGKDKIFSINTNLSIINEIPFVSIPLDSSRPFKYKYSMVYLNSKLLLETEKARIISFDTGLKLLDTIDYRSFGLCENCWGYYQVFTDGEYFYNKVNKDIYKTKDFINIEKVYECNDYFRLFRILNDGLYILEFPNYYFKYSFFGCTITKVFNSNMVKAFNHRDIDITARIEINNFTVQDDEILFVGNNKFFSSTNLEDSIINVISDMTGATNYVLPDKIKDSSFLFYCGYSNKEYIVFTYRTDDAGIRYLPVVDPIQHSKIKDFWSMDFKYFDDDTKKLIFGGYNITNHTSGALISNDTGRTFEFKLMPDFQFKNHKYPRVNLQKKDSLFYTATTLWWRNVFYCTFYVYDSNFNLINRFRDSNIVVDYLNVKDTNNYLIHYLNPIDNSIETKYTNDRGHTWNFISRYDPNVSFLYYKEIEVEEKMITAFFHKNNLDSVVMIDILDTETWEMKRVYEYRLKDLKYLTDIHNSIDYDSSLFYIPIEDTLFYTDNLYDRSTWKYYLFPYNGKVIKTFKKFGDKFFARYRDDIHPENIYWIKINDTQEQKPPVIAADDIEFDKKDIKDTTHKAHSVKIYNVSKSIELIINGRSGPYSPVFEAELPVINAENPLIIDPLDSYEFTVRFKPTEEKVYEDSIIFHSNAIEYDSVVHLTGEGIDTSAVSVENDIEGPEYLYVYPPFPQPAIDKVRMHVYWDLRLEFKPELVKVYDIYGSELSGKGNITLEMADNYSGYLNWDCSGLPTGIYLITIEHGSNRRIAKVILTK